MPLGLTEAFNQLSQVNGAASGYNYIAFLCRTGLLPFGDSRKQSQGKLRSLRKRVLLKPEAPDSVSLVKVQGGKAEGEREKEDSGVCWKQQNGP